MRIRFAAIAALVLTISMVVSCKTKTAGQDADVKQTGENYADSLECDSFMTANGTPIRMYAIKHATVMMQVGEKWIYTDPVTRGALPETDYTLLPKADFILVTHDHYDHLDTVAIKQLSKEDTQIITNCSSRDSIGYGVALANGESMTFGNNWQIDAVPAYNYSDGKTQFHPAGRDNGYIVSIDGFRIYFAGDTEDIPEMSGISNIDVAFLPCNLPFTMTPEQLSDAAGTIVPKVLFPYHYGDTEINRVNELLEGSGIDVRIRQYQ